MFARLLALVALFVLILPLNQSFAITFDQCLPRQAGVEKLTTEWGETVLSRSDGKTGYLIELWTKAEDSAFTVTVTNIKEQTMCLAASGTGWEDVGVTGSSAKRPTRKPPPYKRPLHKPPDPAADI